MDERLRLIPDARCCASLTGADGWVGVTVVHEWPGDGSSHERSVYWRNPPPGRPLVELARWDPLTLSAEVLCSCGWRGRVADGAVVDAA